MRIAAAEQFSRAQARALAVPELLDAVGDGDDLVISSSELVESQRARVDDVMGGIQSAFEHAKQLSDTLSWCDPVPLCVEVEAVQDFIQASFDPTTLPTERCSFCYLRKAPADLSPCLWQRVLDEDLKEIFSYKLQCRSCFPSTEPATAVPACDVCLKAIQDKQVPLACSSELRWLPCQHQYPDVIRDLTFLEERLITVNIPYACVTRFEAMPRRRNVQYRKHVRGHVSVFVGDLEGTARDVLPHPLVRSLEYVHVIWTGPHRPPPTDVSRLLAVRPRKVLAALDWLKQNNPLYSDVTIDRQETESWDIHPGSHLPFKVWEEMQFYTQKTWDKIYTSNPIPQEDVVPEAVHDAEQSTTSIMDELLHLRAAEDDDVGDSAYGSMEEVPDLESAFEEELLPTGVDNSDGSIVDMPPELISSGYISPNSVEIVSDVDKLHYLSNAINSEMNTSSLGDNGDEADVADDPRNGFQADELPGIYKPYVRVSRGSEFADSLDPFFFAKMSVKLFPTGRGGPKRLNLDDTLEQDIKASRGQGNFALEHWTRIVLQRDDGLFSEHPVFMFLVLNILLRSTNRRISNARIAKSSWNRVEELYTTLSREPGRLRRAEEELKQNKWTTDADVYRLLKEVSIYGSQHPFSDEMKTQYRYKIESLNLKHGPFAIWFTINPNDIDHPVKLNLVASRNVGAERAKATLEDLCQRARLVHIGFNDPVSAAYHFMRQIECFFKFYVRTGQCSIFGRISQYFGITEANDRMALHLHGFLWLEGNHALHSIARDVKEETNAAYKAKIEGFLDNLISESVDERDGREMSEIYRTTDYDWDTINSKVELQQALHRVGNFVATVRNIHSHCYSCTKYSFRAQVQHHAGLGPLSRRMRQMLRQPCRYRFPKKLVERTCFDENGHLHIRRNHPMVGQYNRAISAGVRCNHDLVFVLTRKRGFAQMEYALSYGTKKRMKTHERLASAAVVQEDTAQKVLESTTLNSSDHVDADPDASARLGNKARQFWHRLANKVFSDTELSSVEVATQLLGYPLYYCNIKHDRWRYLNLNAVFWVLLDAWPWARRWVLCEDGVDESSRAKFSLTHSGKRLNHLDAYPYRGELLRHLCLYDYCSVVMFRKRSQVRKSGTRFAIDFDDQALRSKWVQVVIAKGDEATVQVKGLSTLWSDNRLYKGADRYVSIKSSWFLFMLCAE